MRTALQFPQLGGGGSTSEPRPARRMLPRIRTKLTKYVVECVGVAKDKQQRRTRTNSPVTGDQAPSASPKSADYHRRKPTGQKRSKREGNGSKGRLLLESLPAAQVLERTRAALPRGPPRGFARHWHRHPDGTAAQTARRPARALSSLLWAFRGSLAGVADAWNRRVWQAGKGGGAGRLFANTTYLTLLQLFLTHGQTAAAGTGGSMSASGRDSRPFVEMKPQPTALCTRVQRA